jgi:Rieske Fe-S protein
LSDSKTSGRGPLGRSRRRFVIYGAGALAAAGGYLARRKVWVEVGPPEDVPATGVFHFQHEGRGVFIMRDTSGEVYALSQRCAHQGCNVQWNAGPSQFECPCHSGVYSATGDRIAGEPFRGLAKLSTRINEAGMLEVLV